MSTHICHKVKVNCSLYLPGRLIFEQANLQRIMCMTINVIYESKLLKDASFLIITGSFLICLNIISGVPDHVCLGYNHVSLPSSIANLFNSFFTLCIKLLHQMIVCQRVCTPLYKPVDYQPNFSILLLKSVIMHSSNIH